MTRPRVTVGLIALIGMLGVLFTPASAGAATPRTRRTTTTMHVTATAQAASAFPAVQAMPVDMVPTLQAAEPGPGDLQAAPANQENLTIPTFTFPTVPVLGNFNTILQDLVTFINNLLRQVFGGLCQLLGGPFCASP